MKNFRYWLYAYCSRSLCSSCSAARAGFGGILELGLGVIWYSDLGLVLEREGAYS